MHTYIVFIILVGLACTYSDSEQGSPLGTSTTLGLAQCQPVLCTRVIIAQLHRRQLTAMVGCYRRVQNVIFVLVLLTKLNRF